MRLFPDYERTGNTMILESRMAVVEYRIKQARTNACLSICTAGALCIFGLVAVVLGAVWWCLLLCFMAALAQFYLHLFWDREFNAAAAELKDLIGERKECKKYILVPGWVRSANDGQRHFINPTALANCWRVPLSACHVVPHNELDRGRWLCANNHLMQECIMLYPDATGEYPQDVLIAQQRARKWA